MIVLVKYKKSQMSKMVVDAARRFLNMVDISGDLDRTLREGFGSGL